MIVSDLIGTALLVVHEKCTNEAITKLISPNDRLDPRANATPEQRKFYDMYQANLTKALCRDESSSKGYDMTNPSSLVKHFTEDITCSEIVGMVVRGLWKPICFPVMNACTGSGGDLEDLDVKTFILCHAVQILMFSPVDWDQDRVYSADPAAYTHRFPTSDLYPGELVVGGRFSLEDLHRAACLFYLAVHRRDSPARGFLLKRVPPSTSKDVFEGYRDPGWKADSFASLEDGEHEMNYTTRKALEAEQAKNAMPSPSSPLSDSDSAVSGLGAIDAHTVVLEAMSNNVDMRFDDEAKKLRDLQVCPPLDLESAETVAKWISGHFKFPDFDAEHQRIKASATSFDQLLSEDDIAQYVDVSSSDRVREAALAPEMEETLDEELGRAYALEMVFNRIQPNPDVDLNAICEDYNISPHPDYKLYPDQPAQALKPHQVAGKSFHLGLNEIPCANHR